MDEMYEMAEGRFFGKYRGKVVENRDPTARGRLQVVVPAVMGEEPVWALPCVPYAGAGVGFFALPEAGTGVWVEFEAGDPSYPIWTGCFWGDGDIPAADAEPTIKFWRTEKLTLRIDDSVGELVIENDSGSVIRLTPTEISQESQQINNKAGGKETALTAVAFDVANGAFRVV
jgi:uncharacterized protein involved in type VI secretion and phage assembly